MKNKLYKPFTFAWMAIVFIFSVILVFIDRLVQAPFVWRDLPGIREIDQFDHEKERISKRLAIYALVVVVYLIYKAIRHFDKVLELLSIIF